MDYFHRNIKSHRKIIFVILFLTFFIFICKKTPTYTDKRSGEFPETDIQEENEFKAVEIGDASLNSEERKLLKIWTKNKIEFPEIPGLSRVIFKDENSHRNFIILSNNVFCNCGNNLTLAGCRNINPSCPLSERKIKDIIVSLITNSDFLSVISAPDFSLTSIWPEPKKTFSFRKLRGKNVIITFWATWCMPCLIEIPIFNKLKKMFKNLEILALSVDYEISTEQLKGMAKYYNIQYPVLRASEEIQAMYFAESLPTTFIIDKNGLITKKIVGSQPLNQLKVLIQKLN
jgi:thiol-disulfide isomerase/thioredoxin